MKFLLISFFVLAATNNALSQDFVFAKDAAKYIGEYIEVEGRVYGHEVKADLLHHGENMALIYVGGGIYPNQKVTLIMRDINGHKKYFENWHERVLKNVRDSLMWKTYTRVRGKIILYRGKPAMEIAFNEFGILEWVDKYPSAALLQNLQ